MKRLMRLTMLAMVWMVPAVGEGQQTAADSRSGAPETSTQVRQAAQTSAAQRPVPTRRRRGSMVGYIDDAAVESKIRLRLDSGFGTTAPDRAEFFYAKCGCYSGLPANHPFFDADAPGPMPGVASELNFQQFYLEGEFRLGSRASVFGLMPFRWLQPQMFAGGGGGFSNGSGASDLRAGAKFALADTADAGVTAKVQFYFPTGDARKGLGTNHGTFEPALLFHNSASDVVEIESQVGVWLPIGGSAPTPTSGNGKFAGNVFYYGVGPSFTVYDRNNVRFAPVVELVGWRVLSGNESVGLDASGTNIVNLKIGGRFVFSGNSVYVGYGHALTDKTWYDDIVRFEYRYAF